MVRSAFYICSIGVLFSVWFVSATAVAAPRKLPPAVRIILIKVNAMIQKKDYSRAVETLLAFQAKGGPPPAPGRSDGKGYHHPEIYYSLGNCYLYQDQYAPAITAYGDSLARDPDHTFAWLNLAKASYEVADYAQAGRCFGRGYETAQEKKSVHIYYSAVAYFMAGDHRQSIATFDRLLANHPGALKPQWKENLVHALMAADLQRRALPYIRELAGIYTGDKQIQWQEILLYQYVKLDMRVEALAYARTLTRRAPAMAKWWKALTHIQLNDGRYKEALAALTIYSFLKPLTLDEKKLLADLNLQLGIPVKAAPVYEDYLRERTDKKLLQQLALAYSQLDRPEIALKRIDTFQINPGDVDLMLLKGQLHYLLKQYDKAAAAYRKAAQIKGKHVGRAWLMAGYAAWQMDDIAASRKAFAKARAHDRQKKAAASALRQLARLPVKGSQP
ncbi:MAG: tetratricopeptide repeat protein [Desulfobacteraceae bacterium]|jgi:tetratricopeptide (TPR) repeat protein